MTESMYVPPTIVEFLQPIAERKSFFEQHGGYTEYPTDYNDTFSEGYSNGEIFLARQLLKSIEKGYILCRV